MEDLVESECERHGLGLHIVFHEAGHAVAAVDHDLPFRRIVLYDAEGGPTFDNGLRRAAAAVEMHSEDASTWVQPDQDAALRFVLAGCLAEIAALGHAIEGGFTGDIRAWRIGAGRANEMTAAELDSLVGQPFLDVVTQVQKWASENLPRIQRLAEHLQALGPGSELSRDQVIALLQ